MGPSLATPSDEALIQRRLGIVPAPAKPPDPSGLPPDEARANAYGAFAQEKFHKARTERKRPKLAGGERTGGSLSWPIWILIDVTVIASVAAAVFVAPPFVQCSDREVKFGFFYGDSFENCLRTGVQARWDTLDARLKMLVRGSGR